MINSKDLLDLMAYFHKRKDSRLLGVLSLELSRASGGIAILPLRRCIRLMNIYKWILA